MLIKICQLLNILVVVQFGCAEYIKIEVRVVLCAHLYTVLHTFVGLTYMPPASRLMRSAVYVLCNISNTTSFLCNKCESDFTTNMIIIFISSQSALFFFTHSLDSIFYFIKNNLSIMGPNNVFKKISFTHFNYSQAFNNILIRFSMKDLIQKNFI